MEKLNGMVFHFCDFFGARPAAGTEVTARCGQKFVLGETLPSEFLDERACPECLGVSILGRHNQSLIGIQWTGGDVELMPQEAETAP